MLIHQNTNVMNKKMTDFFAQAQGLINGLNEGGQYGTAQNYSKSCSSLKAFIADTEGGPDGTLYVEEMDDRIIARYNHYLSERGGDPEHGVVLQQDTAGHLQQDCQPAGFHCSTSRPYRNLLKIDGVNKNQ